MGCYLATSGEAEYPPEVAGNWEVFCYDDPDGHIWKFDHGIYTMGNIDEDEYDGEDDDSEG
jgi:hypothetical protein